MFVASRVIGKYSSKTNLVINCSRSVDLFVNTSEKLLLVRNCVYNESFCKSSFMCRICASFSDINRPQTVLSTDLSYNRELVKTVDTLRLNFYSYQSYTNSLSESCCNLSKNSSVL